MSRMREKHLWHRSGMFWLLVLTLTGGCSSRRERVQALAEAEPPIETASTDEQKEEADRAEAVKAKYEKQEYAVPMRDGVKLFTAVYAPRDTSRTYPFILLRTPYSVRPYGADEYKERLGPSELFDEEGYIFVFQDVRGKFMSEGYFDNMRPHIPSKESPTQIDESTDTYDTIEWLLANVPNHNGRVGMWGISYPGFYAAAGMIDAHPALKAVSPQAPIADWYFDDFHHHGALFLPHTFNFFASFGKSRPLPTTEWGGRFDHGTRDGYKFFKELGPLKNADEKYFKGEIAFWTEAMQHPDYDAFWQSRNLLPHLRNVAPAVMFVGGWYDAEDLYGVLKNYRSVEEKNPSVSNVIVMGPWPHGGWGRRTGDQLGVARFGTMTSLDYREKLEFPFLQCHLKDDCGVPLAEATMFETGANRWREFAVWPPAEAAADEIYFGDAGTLTFDEPGEGVEFDEYVSDPAKPVPYTQTITTGMTKEYMTDDQRFAARRPDVLVYQSEPLEEPLTLAGPVLADLWVSTSGTDSDWVVKLIDVFPSDAEDPKDAPEGWHLGDAQLMVRSEVIRGRYRNSYEHPEPFVPNEPANVKLELLDVLHTFQPGHRIMVQIQSTWFPMVDLNPQTYVPNINFANESDFVKATQRVYHSPAHPTRLHVRVLPQTEPAEQAADSPQPGGSAAGE